MAIPVCCIGLPKQDFSLSYVLIPEGPLPISS